MGDDLVHRAWLLGPSALPSTVQSIGLVPENSAELSSILRSLFSFTGPHLDPENLFNSGYVPWWTMPNISLSFWRPVTALTHWVDYQFWPNSTILMHAHNILWFSLAVFAVSLLYRRMLTSTWAAGLAALFFALDDNYFSPVGSISKRNVLIALLFGVLAILAHDRWRRKKSNGSAVLSAGFLLLSVLSTEAGISAVAYIAAYALFIERGRWSKRILSLTPSLLVIFLWRVRYSSLGYGVMNSGLYIDPLSEPIRFALSVLERGPILLFSQWALPPPEVFAFFSEPLMGLIWLLLVASLVIILFFLFPLLRQDREARFWAAGMIFSVIPACAISMPSGRVLLFIGLGTMGLIARFVTGLQANEGWIPERRRWRNGALALSITLVVFHVAFSTIGRFVAPMAMIMSNSSRDMLLEVKPEPELEQQKLIIVNSPSPFLFMYFPFLRAQQAKPVPLETRILSPTFGGIEISRPKEDTLVIKSSADSLLSLEAPPPLTLGHPIFILWRANDTFIAEKFLEGKSRHLEFTGVEIEVEEINGSGYPKQASFEFEKALTDPYYKWLTWDWKTWSYLPFELPAIGESQAIAGPF